MPRKNPILSAEAEICARLSELRAMFGLSRIEFARRAGIGLEQLRRYELQRAPLKSGDALKICEAFDVGNEWLATGHGEVDGIRVLLKPSEPERPFSEVYVDQVMSWLREVKSGYREEAQRELRSAIARLESGGYTVAEQDRLCGFLRKLRERAERRATRPNQLIATVEAALRQMPKPEPPANKW